MRVCVYVRVCVCVCVCVIYYMPQVLELCFKLYLSRDTSVHSTAGVAIRQIVTALFERVLVVSARDGVVNEEEGEEKEGDLSREAGDAYLLFQVWSSL